ncbi:MAG: dihydrodipicolinate synthase family protein [Bacteroidota bacterium]
MHNKLAIRGIIPPLVTPLIDNDTLDKYGLEQLIEHVIAGGVNGIFILGTSGEFASLSYALRQEMIQRTCELVNQRVPVLVGVTDSAFRESLNQAKLAADHGADALVISPPYYFPSGQAELIEYMESVLKHSSLPMFLYNMPMHTKVMIEPQTVLKLSENPNIVGMKDSSANLVYYNKVQYLLRDRDDFTFLVGPEELTAQFVLLGGDGGVNGGANMFPKLYVNLYNAAVNKNFDQVFQLQQKVMQIATTIYGVGQYNSSFLKGVKCVLSLLGICNDFLAEPFHKYNPPEREKIKHFLKELNYADLL